MTTDINQINFGNKEFQDVPNNLEYDQYLFEIFRNDHIENQVQRMMEHCNEKSSNRSACLMTNELNPM